MNSFELNKVLGAILGTCLITLALNIGASAIFAPEKPAKPGYNIAVEQHGEGGAATAAKEPEQPIETLLASASVEKGQATASAPPCGGDDIQPLFYALDMMVPVMALHQLDKCWVDTRPGTAGWRVFWSLFSFVGKLVTSLALLTYSGVLKPKEEV